MNSRCTTDGTTRDARDARRFRFFLKREEALYSASRRGFSGSKSRTVVFIETADARKSGQRNARICFWSEYVCLWMIHRSHVRQFRPKLPTLRLPKLVPTGRTRHISLFFPPWSVLLKWKQTNAMGLFFFFGRWCKIRRRVAAQQQHHFFSSEEM